MKFLLSKSNPKVKDYSESIKQIMETIFFQIVTTKPYEKGHGHTIDWPAVDYSGCIEASNKLFNLNLDEGDIDYIKDIGESNKDILQALVYKHESKFNYNGETYELNGYELTLKYFDYIYRGKKLV